MMLFDKLKNITKSQRRGSVMVLVVVVIVMMVLMGLMFLQAARTQRIAIGRTPGGNINAAMKAVNAEIAKALQNDLVDKEGNFFNPTNTDANGNILNDSSNNPTGYDEPYDYPWTNSDPSTDHAVHSFVTGQNNSSVIGGQNDDTWLASTQPTDFTSTTVTWPHITDLTGMYLQWDSQANSGQGTLALVGNNPKNEDFVTTAPITAGFYNNSDTNLTVYTNPDAATATQTNLYDADGDGIPDSRWAWVPMPTINGHIYIMAVRIVDLDSMLNINTALSSIDGTGAYDSANDNNAPHFLNPSAWNLGNWMRQIDNPASTTIWQSDLASLLYYRSELDAGNQLYAPPQTAPIGFLSQMNRNDFWSNIGRYTYPGNTPDTEKLFSYGDEASLRYGNGLAKDGDTSVVATDTTTGLPTFLRGGNGASEQDWQDVDLTTYGGGAAGSNTAQQYFNLEPRHQLTTASGTAIYAPLPNAPKGYLKLNPNTSSFGLIARRIYGIANLSNSTNWLGVQADNAMAFPQYLDTSNTLQTATPVQFTAQFMANLVDYEDSVLKLETGGVKYAYPGQAPPANQAALRADQQSNALTQYTYTAPDGSTATAIGFEFMPMLSEVYLQREYKTTTFTQVGTVGPNKTYTITWEPTTSKAGYAIEISNPYSRPVDLTTAFLYVNGQNWNGDPSWTPGSDPLPISTFMDENGDGKPDATLLMPNQSLIIYRDSTGHESTQPSAADQQYIGEDDGATPSGLVTPNGGTNAFAKVYKYAVDSTNTNLLWPSSGAGISGNIQVQLRPMIHRVQNPNNINDTDNADSTGITFVANWPYCAVPVKKLPASVTSPAATPVQIAGIGTPDTEYDYAQRFAIGSNVRQGTNGERPDLALLVSQIDPANVDPDSKNQDTTGSDGLRLQYSVDGAYNPTPDDTKRDLTFDNLGQYRKSNCMIAAGDLPSGFGFDVAENQIILRNGNLKYAGELANLFLFGPSFFQTGGSVASPPTMTGNTFATQWAKRANVQYFQLRFNNPGQPVTPTTPYPANYVFNTGNFYIPYGEFLVSQFTTLQPSPGSLVVPGMINVNTVPVSLLKKILPVADEGLKNKIINKIIEVRSDPNRTVTGVTNLRGISNLGTLLYNSSDGAGTAGLSDLLTTNQPATPGTPPLLNTDATNYQGKTTDTTSAQTGVRLDFQNPEDSAGNSVNDNIPDDQEEKTMLLKYLKQMATVRSDRFVAYVEVRGYDSADFNAGPTAIRRYIAIFGRGVNQDGQAKVLYMEITSTD